MNFRIVVFLASTIFTSFSFASELPVQEKINQLNQTTIESIGISLNALSYLVGATPNSYIPLWHLKESGDIDYVQELEKAGYVRVEIIDELPGAETQEQMKKQVKIIPLQSGVEIQRCMIALKHNN